MATKEKSETAKPDSSSKADIDRVLEILRTLPNLRRYGGDEQALKDAVSLLEQVKERL